MNQLSALRRGSVSAILGSTGLLVLAALSLLPVAPGSSAENARFFRIASPSTTTIVAISPDGYVTWSNAAIDVTCTFQTALTLVGPGNWVDYVRVPVSNHVITQRLFDPNAAGGMAFIPAGSFTMGNCMDPAEGGSNELPLHTVYVSAFYMDQYEVTKALWDTVKTWATANGYQFDHGGSGKSAHHPVHEVDWYDVVKWCNARSQQEGRTPCYYTDASLVTIYETGQVVPHVKWNANGYRLPTEAEWEKGARGGASGRRFPWSDTDNITHSRANYYSTDSYSYDTSPTRGYHPTFDDGGFPYISPVGYFTANGYGLYDMAGNVWEWCWDWYEESWYSHPGAALNDPRGPAGPSSVRVMRGGSCNGYAFSSRCALRSDLTPASAYLSYGFRCVRGL